MTGLAVQFDRDEFTEMLGAELRRRSPSAKHLARVAGCDVRSAEEYRAGRRLPTLLTFINLAREWGDLAECVLRPDAALVRLEQEERELAEQLELVRRRRQLVAQGANRVGPSAGSPSQGPRPARLKGRAGR